MVKYRIMFCAWVLFWLAVWVFANENIGIYIAAATIICVLAEVLLACLSSKRLTAEMSSSPTGAKGEDVPVLVTVKNSGFLSCAKLRVKIDCINLMTGQKTDKEIWLCVKKKSKGEEAAVINSDTCGKIAFNIREIRSYDAFGLFYFKRAAKCNAALLILPDIFPVETAIGTNLSYDVDSAEYSMTVPGEDMSEIFSLREYQAGDGIRKIHWKLSEKTDKLIVREPALPVNNSVLLMLDNVCGKDKREPKECEALCETAVCVSLALCDKHFAHDIGWYDSDKKTVVTAHITCEEDLNAALCDLLAARTVYEKKDILSCFNENRSITDFSHVIAVTDDKKEKSMTGQTLVSYISPIKKGERIYVEV